MPFFGAPRGIRGPAWFYTTRSHSSTTQKLLYFRAAITNYGTLSTANIDGTNEALSMPTRLRSPAPPDPSPMTTNPHGQSSTVLTGLGSWKSRRVVWEPILCKEMRCGKGCDRGSSTAPIKADPEQSYAESSLSLPATPADDVDRNDK